MAWQSSYNRAWYPIGRLDVNTTSNEYVFAYTIGAEEAQKEVGFQPLASFPDFEKVYKSRELFPIFESRILSPNRREFKDYISTMDLNPQTADPLEILALTNGERLTDNLEVFPKIEKSIDGSFACRFFLHGWRHTNQHSETRLLKLKHGEGLRLAIELDNPATKIALTLLSDDYYMLGWTPRYLVRELLETIQRSPMDVSASVVKVNTEAPHRQKVLIEIKGKWPEGYSPMATKEFQLIEQRLSFKSDRVLMRNVM